MIFGNVGRLAKDKANWRGLAKACAQKWEVEGAYGSGRVAPAYYMRARLRAHLRWNERDTRGRGRTNGMVCKTSISTTFLHPRHSRPRISKNSKYVPLGSIATNKNKKHQRSKAALEKAGFQNANDINMQKSKIKKHKIKQKNKTKTKQNKNSKQKPKIKTNNSNTKQQTKTKTKTENKNKKQKRKNKKTKTKNKHKKQKQNKIQKQKQKTKTKTKNKTQKHKTKTKNEKIKQN